MTTQQFLINTKHIPLVNKHSKEAGFTRDGSYKLLSFGDDSSLFASLFFQDSNFNYSNFLTLKFDLCQRGFVFL